MKVTFTRTHARGYCVSVEGKNIDRVTMAPAPGYDDRLPHDVAHFIVESELGIMGGVFGQLAAGGTASTFHSAESKNHKKARKRGTRIAKANKKDALFSEHAIWAAQSRWEKHDIIPSTDIPTKDIERIIARFEDFAGQWSKLPTGGSMSLEWPHDVKLTRSKKAR
ncbi:MAG: hypothetical protein HOP17_10855 [Acidobacteria bacterium]|nr:hypothetical protein [Acidobacteriota bacterium]